MRRDQRKLPRSEKKLLTNMKPRDKRKMLPGKTTAEVADTTMTEIMATIDVITTVIIATRSKDTKRKTLTKTKEVSHMEKVAKRSVEETAIRTIEMTEIKSKKRRMLSLRRSPKKKCAKRSRRISKSLYSKSKTR
jgi:hypothetical protein